MASPDRPTGSTLKRIYQSGEWSDLTISTATRDFHVHKAIVCPACPFFEAACTRDFREARTGVVTLPESAEAVEGILKFIYGLPLGEVTVEHATSENINHLRQLVDMHVAADKYDLPGLWRLTKRSIITYIVSTTRVDKLVDQGQYTYQQDCGTVDQSIMRYQICAVAKSLPAIRQEDHVWQKLVANAEFLAAAIDQALEWGKPDAGRDALHERVAMEEEEQFADIMRLWTELHPK
ncbi:hypothetical protein CB0940_10425 [Cercospora beticola]|uniref:BTB domain-containing protein n=1 Tax=Cercospora beticola TaxID=122368 RepID=A0A2G5HUC7_CERBT|nr:hypothetical protein CB0940_10425 [Cercospora beticola]PIA96136.1 hypothetical protein CB0940_10425 [Cercospora beticola]WPB07142.1 hypothetical protein RHO25_011802 [Cercospora beticola]CAK1367098.1 unnamed protein product [Cercospora beticola]